MSSPLMVGGVPVMVGGVPALKPDGVDCCCDEGTVSTACCVELLQETLTATISSKTGDCSCLPDSVSMTWAGDPDFVWTGSYSECGGCTLELSCDGTPVFAFGSASCAAAPTLVSVSCDPFEVVFDVDNSIGGTTNCTGTYRVTITA